MMFMKLKYLIIVCQIINFQKFVGIRAKFQLLSNQRNQQKREVCRECFQTGKRGTIYGISFFYEGSQFWDKRFPPKGKDAEAGCIGCAWYDIAKWREELINVIKKASEIKEK